MAGAIEIHFTRVVERKPDQITLHVRSYVDGVHYSGSVCNVPKVLKSPALKKLLDKMEADLKAKMVQRARDSVLAQKALAKDG